MAEHVDAPEFPTEGISPGNPYHESHDNYGSGPIYPAQEAGFLSLPTREKISKIGGWVEFQLHGIDAFDQTGDPSHLPERINSRVAGFDALNSELHDKVSAPEALEVLERVSSRLKRPNEKKVAENLDELRKGKRKLICDFDGTFSDPSDRTGEFDELLPGSDPLDAYLGEGRRNFKYAAAYWEDVMVEEPELFAAGGSEVPLRPGILEFLEAALNDPDIEVNILTTNFEPYIDAFVKRVKGGDRIRKHCIRPGDIRSVAKADMIRALAIEDPDSLIEYVGDSKTDLGTVEDANIIGAFHSVEGLPFDQRLTEEGIEHMTFTDGYGLASNMGIQLQLAA